MKSPDSIKFKWPLILALALLITTAILIWEVREPPYENVFYRPVSKQESVAITRILKRITYYTDLDRDPDLQYEIGRYDINNDNIPDVFLQAWSRGYIGSLGWINLIFILDKKKKWHVIYDTTGCGDIGILKTSHNGFRDLLSFGPCPDPRFPLCEPFATTLHWDGKNYQYIRFRTLTSEDAKISADERY